MPSDGHRQCCWLANVLFSIVYPLPGAIGNVSCKQVLTVAHSFDVIKLGTRSRIISLFLKNFICWETAPRTHTAHSNHTLCPRPYKPLCLFLVRFQARGGPGEGQGEARGQAEAKLTLHPPDSIGKPMRTILRSSSKAPLALKVPCRPVLFDVTNGKQPYTTLGYIRPYRALKRTYNACEYTVVSRIGSS